MEALAILRDVTYSRLSLTSDDMRNRSSQTKALLARQEDLERDQEMLEAELDELRREQEETAAVLTMDIQRLQEKVHAVKEAYDHGMRRITTTAHEEQTAASNAFAASSDDLKDQVEKLQAKLEVKLKDSASAEAEAKKRKNRYVIEIKKMQGEYDTRMADIQAAIDEMRKKHDDEVAELEKLQLHFKYVDEDLARQDAENKAYEDAKAAKRKAQMEALFSASCKIQAMIRGWYTRRRLAELMPLSKGKKKRK
jgi:chromosome segregation ATPase